MIAGVGCSSDGNSDNKGSQAATSPASSSPPSSAPPAPPASPSTGEPSASPAPTLPPAVLPKNPAEAQETVRRLTLVAEDWGAGFLPGDPYEQTDMWSVLGADCAWQRGDLPRNAVATLTRKVLDSASGGGSGHSTVTVFTSVDAARARIAEVASEAGRCPVQQLAGGALTGLSSTSQTGDNQSGEELLIETGTYTRADGTQRVYMWGMFRTGTVTGNIWIEGADGETQSTLVQRVGRALGLMTSRLSGLKV